MGRRRFVVAYEAMEDCNMRIFMMAWTGNFDRPRRIGKGVFWCGADKPDGILVKPVYNSTKVDEKAYCCECGIAIRTLQQMMM